MTLRSMAVTTGDDEMGCVACGTSYQHVALMAGALHLLFEAGMQLFPPVNGVEVYCACRREDRLAVEFTAGPGPE